MRKRISLRTYLMILFALFLFPFPVRGAGDLTAQQPIELRVAMGSKEDALRFFPELIPLETGKLYRLIFLNPSKQKHYFSSEGMSQAVFTRKVQINGMDGKPISEAVSRRGQCRNHCICERKDGFMISTGHGLLSILELQPAGRKSMTGPAFVMGRRLQEGMRIS